MHILEYLGSKQELEKIDKLIGINRGRIFLSTAAENNLVIRLAECLILSESLDIMCGESFLTEGKYLHSGVLAAQEHSYGKFLPCNKATWLDMRERGDRHRDDQDLDGFWRRMQADGEMINVSEEFVRGNYMMESGNSMDIRNHRTTKSAASESVVILTDSSGRFFAPCYQRIIKGLHLLGAEIWLKFLPEFSEPFFFFTIDELHAVGMIGRDDRLMEKSGPKETPDGRLMSHTACKVSWVVPEKAYEMIERDGRMISDFRRNGSSSTGYLDHIVAAHGSMANGLRLGISVLRWNGLVDEEIDKTLSDIEDQYLQKEVENVEIEARNTLDRLHQTRNLGPAQYQMSQLHSRFYRVATRIQEKYPGHVATSESLNMLQDYMEADIPF